jgi:hypothetical protein
MSYTPEELEAVQHVVERVGANWDAATEETVEEHLRKALDEAGLELPDDDIRSLAEAVDAHDGTVSAAAVLGR